MEKNLYKYRLFTNFGLVFVVLSDVETKDELWSAIINSKDEVLDKKFLRTNDVNGNLGEINIRPSVIAAIETPDGNSPVKLANDHKQAQKDVVRRSPGRIVISSKAGNNVRGLFSKQKRTR